MRPWRLTFAGTWLLLAAACSDGGGLPNLIGPPCAPTGQTKTVEGIEFVEIGPGSFLMGSGREAGSVGEQPVHEVEFDLGFWIARSEVTNEDFEWFDPKHPRDRLSPGDRDPVVNVSFEEAQAYCKWISVRSGLLVRLPTESEWEAACRAGSSSRYCFGDTGAGLAEYGWFDRNSDGRAHKVGTLRANAWVLFDLHGNVREWCGDAWHSNYEGAPTDGSAWTAGGGAEALRVCRGGSWGRKQNVCRSAFREGVQEDRRDNDLGFRPAMEPHVE